MPEAFRPIADSLSAPGVLPPGAVSPKDMDRMPIAEVIRHRLLAKPGTKQLMRNVIDHSVELGRPPDETPETGNIYDRRGIITGRTHDQVVGNNLE